MQDMHPDDEWQVEHLDIGTYLERIAYTGPLTPTAEVLHDLHVAHAASIPFENLDIVLGRTPALDMEALQDKLLRHERGGYCYEHNLLFAALLERLGFAVSRLAARVGTPDPPLPRTHMLLQVLADGDPWLADVGFGAGLQQPMPLRHDVVVPQGGWTYQLRHDGEETWRLRSRDADGWSDLYSFTLEQQHHVDYVMANHFTATHPSSPFVGRVVAIRAEPDVRHTLRGADLTHVRPDGSEHKCAVDHGELLEVLEGTFHIRLPERDARTLSGGGEQRP
jgi:N-hydroxyarylamine O-acetyltransferase